MIEAIPNYLVLPNGVGTGGQPSEAQLRELAEAGYEVVINLALPTSPNALADEAGTVAGAGMEYISIPVEWERPAEADYERFVAAMRENAGRKVFVHCAMNKRVSAFLYRYRVREEGVAPEVAAVDLRRVWEPEGIWGEFVNLEF
jgi:protein tyrosine phosphatase (PTP) superfamily phosphohydrolase (DUF442 family)